MVVNEEFHKINVLYIASASRSGSTILEHSLGALQSVCNCGELRRLRDFYTEKKSAILDPKNPLVCTCGEKFRDCEFWRTVEEKSGMNFSTINLSSQLGRVDRTLFKLAFFLFGPRATRWISTWYKPFKKDLEAAENCFRIHLTIASITNCNFIVDSSKMIHQFLMLKSARPDALKLIALVRDGRAVSKSMIRGERKKQFNVGEYSSARPHGQELRAAALSWVTSTLLTFLFYFRTPKDSRYFVKYETVCQEPDFIINEIVSKFGTANTVRKSTVSTELSHAVGGSPSRFDENFGNVKVDEGWRNDWTEDDSRVFAWYGGLVNWILGYK